jgi:CrcB protein
MNIWLAVFLGGGLGSLCRFAVSRLIISRAGSLPWATIGVNVLACIVLALVMLRYQNQLTQRPAALALLAVGFCGGFSTFSTFSWENYVLMKEGHLTMALLNVIVSIVACTGVFYILAQRT